MGDQAAAMQSHIPLPPKLDLGGNISQTWKTWKQIWNSYVIVTGLADKDNAYQMATFITCIGHEALEVYNGLPFRDENEKNDPTVILRLMEEYFVGKTNTIYERYVFNNKHQESCESVDAYVTKLRKLSLTCEFGQLADQMIRDRIVCGIKDNAVRKKLLQEADLSLQKCVDICRAAEKTPTQIKSMNLQDEVHALNKSSRKPLKANAPHKEQRKGGKPHHAGGKPHHASGKSHQASIQERRKLVQLTAKSVQIVATRTTLNPYADNPRREYICWRTATLTLHLMMKFSVWNRPREKNIQRNYSLV